MIGIYKITNQINKKVYIGQSQNISKRWKAHRTNYQKDDYPIYRAMRKYGINNFSFEVIEECSLEELDDKEKYWIKYYDSHNPSNGYNLTDGGNTSMPLKLTKQQVKDIITLLSTTTLSQKEIGEKFNVTQRTISSINIGETWVQENISYPIRKNISYPPHKKTNNFQPTYKTCIICGKQINNTSTYCPTCWGLEHRIVKNRPTRDVLKNLIRTFPFTKIGEQYGVSDNAIRKWCKRLNLPYRSAEIKKYTDEEWEKI